MTKLRYNLIHIMNLLALAFTLCMLACSTVPPQPVTAPALLPHKADFRITAQTRDPKQGCVKRYNKTFHQTDFFNEESDIPMDFKITDGIPGQNGEFKIQLFAEPLIPGKATKFVLVLYRKDPKGRMVPIDTGMAFVTDPAFALISRFLDPAHDIEIEVQLSSGKMDALLN